MVPAYAGLVSLPVCGIVGIVAGNYWLTAFALSGLAFDLWFIRWGKRHGW